MFAEIEVEICKAREEVARLQHDINSLRHQFPINPLLFQQVFTQCKRLVDLANQRWEAKERAIAKQLEAPTGPGQVVIVPL